MPVLPLAIGLAVLILSEWILWRILHKKIQGLRFPHELDASMFRVFSLGRLRALAIVHTLALGIAYCILLLTIW